MRKAVRFRDSDWMLLALALAIAAAGLVEIYSTTSHTALAGQFSRQIYWIVIGTVLALVISRFDYHLIVEQTPWLYVLTVLALAGLLVAGPSIAGTRRWIPIGGLTFQVSELAKLVIMLTVAAYFAERRGRFVTWKDFVQLGALVGLPAILVAKEPDLGTALTFFPIAAAGFFLAGVRARQVAVLALLGALILPVGWHLLKPYQRDRLTSYIHPTQDTQGTSYQGTQAKIAIGSGGFWGKGVGNGTQSRLGFVPVSHADFIFAAFAEEQGFAGTLFVLLLYLALLLRLLDGAQSAGDRAGALLLVGFAAVLFFQIAVNIGMMIGFFPITGIPLPLMSQGGSAVMFFFLGLGLAMSVNMRRFVN
ncbi:MAG: rod shape-determining protein RodA [Terriglobia bacterium]